MRLLLALVATLAILDAPAFFLFPVTATVVEYHNSITGHYFMTVDTAEMADIDAGVAGPGWYKTGRAFEAFSPFSQPCTGCQPAERFYAPSPNSHFYSGNLEEVLGLRRPGTGWINEKTAFQAPLPDADGECTQAGSPVPVYRLYNNRWMFNDSNHRYVTSTAERDAMIARGWIDEGARFCAVANVEPVLKSFLVQVPTSEGIMPSSECEDDAVRTGSCVAINNLPIPRMPLGSQFFGMPEYTRLTGIVAQPFVPATALPHLAYEGPFVQLGGSVNFGIHVDTRGKSIDQASSINPLYQLPSEASPDSERFYPWRSTYPYEAQLAIKWSIMVQKVLTRSPGHHAYGHPTLEFVDRASGRHLYFTVLSYGTIGGGDYLAPDVFTGKVIVGTAPGLHERYGRNMGSTWIPTESGYEASDSTVRGGIFDFRIDRSEFGRIVESARTVDPLLSTDPEDYYLDNFHFNNEVAGDGEIGLTLGGFRLEVLRR